MSAPGQTAYRLEEAQRLARALEALPGDQFLALSLKYLEGWPLDLVAQTLHVSVLLVAGLLRDSVCRLVQPDSPASGAETVEFPTVPTDALDAALADYLRSVDAGQEVDRAGLLDQYPDLGSYFAAADRLADLAGVLRGEWTSRRTAPATEGDSLGDDPQSSASAAINIPGYVILGVLGQGGMGIVYKAVHLPLRRTVALKVLRTGSIAGRSERARFLTEAQAVARSQHPNIVQVFEIGEHVGLPYCVLEYVPGGTLAARLARSRGTAMWAADLVRTLARAVHFAHERQVVHRDLKPSNVLLAEDGSPKVADFGLAKLLDDDPGLTRGNAVVGTPSYMAPEQAEGRKDVGPLADVWALGAILYECLTGRPPFLGATQLETLHQVTNRDPIAVRSLNRIVPRDLETIVHKCLEKAPDRRYGSANELAEDLGRFLAGEPIKGRPRGWLSRAGRVVGKNPVAIVAVLSALSAVIAWQPLGQTPEPEPEHPRKVFNERLASGLSYRLPDDAPLPGPFRQSYGEGAMPTRARGEPHFVIDTHGIVAWEFTDDPQSDRYELSADVRHDEANLHSEVGIYVNWREDRPDGKPRRGGFHTLTFSERGTAPQRDAAGVFTSEVTFSARQFQDGPRPDVPEGRIARVLFRPDLPKAGPGPWRTLRIRVAPDGVVPVWEPTPDDTVTVTRSPLPELVRSMRSGPRELRGFPSEFRPRGGVGLYVAYGKASFRNLTITPLEGG